jgi:hypothetical protein
VVVSFLTLILGLAWGERPVAVAVRGDVAIVELRLDGFVAGQLVGAPWKGSVDFGPDLLPHELVAVALDSSGKEIGTARRWVNLPRPSAEASFVLEMPSPDGTRVARLSWHCIGVDRPLESKLTFDGKPFKVPTLSRFELPAYDPSNVHLLRADLDFGRKAATAVAFVGGQERDQTSAELTAVPIRLTGAGPVPSASAMADWFLADGKPVRIEAVEEGKAQVMIVADHEAEGDLRRLGKHKSSEAPMRLPSFAEYFVGIPFAGERRQSDYVYHVFPLDGPLDPKDGDVASAVATRMARLRRMPLVLENLSFAVASAATSASEGGHRRAVVVILGPRPRDAGELTPALVKSFLESLRVPLHVIQVDPGPDLRAWGELRHAPTRPLLAKAVAAIADDLERQRIVWIQGAYLPQSISLAPQAAGIELAR